MNMQSPVINRIKIPKRFHHDFETYSKSDVTKVGASRYSRHPTTEVLMLGYCFDGGPVKQWVPPEGQLMPAEVEDAMLDDRILKFAWNKPFEWNIWKHSLGIDTPHRAWRDPMVLALSCSLPGKLEKAGPVMGLDERYLKQKSGTRLINWFSKDRPATKTKPGRRIEWFEKYDLWLEFLEYNRFDVEAERKIYLNLSPYDLPEHEWELWAVDQEINERGIPINMGMVQNAIQIRDEVVADHMEDMRSLTGLDNPNSGPQLLPWLQDNGYPFSDLKAGHVRRAVEKLKEAGPGDNRPKELREVLDLRLQVSKTSTKKFDALSLMVDEDGRLRNAHQFAGAGRTWRWAGRGFQVQNLAKPEKGLDGLDWETLPSGYKRVVGGTQIAAAEAVATMDAETLGLLYDKPMDVLSGAVRTVVQAPPGYVFIDADLAAIENVGLGWVAGDRKILSVFSEGKDPYIDFATFLYKRPYDELFREFKVGGDKSKRTIAKPGVLGCLRGDTPVLTDKGWKALVEVAETDWLHDGEKWVRHAGVVFKGYQEVLCRSGVYATPDHKFLADSEWVQWQQASRQTTFESVLATGSGVFWGKRDRPAARERGFFADANVVENGSYQDRTLCGDYPRNAPAALRLTVAPTSGKGQGHNCSTYSQIVSTLRGRVATTRRTVPTVTTGVAEYVAYSVPQMNGWPTSRETSTLTEPWRSTGSTTTDTTKWETCDSRHDLNRTQICDTWDILNSGDFARFAVLTEDGCVVAHNCGYMLSAGDEYEDKASGEIEATGLLGYAWNMGVRLTKDQSELSVKVWRDTYTEAVQFWWDIDKAARKCISTGKETSVRSIRFDRKGPFLRMILPSGRCLHYIRPKLEEWRMPWGKYKLSPTYEQLDDKHQWGRVSTHPGKWTENCLSGETLVLTDSGVKPIVEVEAIDRVWDGIAWVRHGGLARNGKQDTISVEGSRFTEDHRIHVGGKWCPAGSVSGHAATSTFERTFGTATRHALREKAFGVEREGDPLVGRLRLWGGDRDARFGVLQRSGEIVRVQQGEGYGKTPNDARHESTSRLPRLEVYDRQVFEQKAQSLEKLRGPGNSSLPPVGEVRVLLGGHGADLREGADLRSSGQRAGLHPAELFVENGDTTKSEHKSQPDCGHALREDDGLGSGGGFGDRKNDNLVSGGGGVSEGEDVRPTRRNEQVYDLLNCGPRHRFTVVTPDGRMMLVHNCVQAIARDLLAHGMTLANRRGIRIVMHVHDQIVALVKENEAEAKLKILMECMGERPSWAPTIPVRAAGHISRWFVKD